MAKFALGFEAYAASHPGCGEPITDEFPHEPFTCQLTTSGMLVYEPIERQIGFLERGTGLVVAADSLRLRRQPSTASAIIVDMPRGTPVHQLFEATIEADGFHWAYLQVESLAAEGYAAIEYLSDGQAPADDGLSLEPDYEFGFETLWPYIQAAGAEFGFDAQVLAGIIKQESGFTNWLLHEDGQGRGLLGLDPRGLLGDFATWTGLDPGPNNNPAVLPVVPQLRYAARELAEYAGLLGGAYNAARAWHRGEGQWQDAIGAQYEQLIRNWVAVLFR